MFPPVFAALRNFAPVLLIAGAATAQTFHWNPSANLANGVADAQRSYNWTANADGSGAWPKSSLDDDFSGSLSGWKTLDSTRAAAGSGATFAISGGQLSISARGADVWFANTQYAAAYKDYPGDFDVSVKIASQTEADEWSKAGIIVMNKFADPSDGGCFAVIVTPKHGIKIQWDSSSTQSGFDWPEGPANQVGQTTFPVWLRATKKGGTFYGYSRASLSAQWTLLGTAKPLNTGTAGQVGLFVASHNTGLASTVGFDDFQGGGDISATGIDLSLGAGTSSTAQLNARLGGALAVKSIAFSGFAGAFDFQSFALTLTGNADFGGAASVIAGPGALIFGAGNQTLTPKAGATFPAITKGAGTLTLGTRALAAGTLTLNGGTLDCGSRSHEFAGLAGTGGSIAGLTAADTLTFAGGADFRAIASLPASGTIRIRARADQGSARTVAFQPGSASFNHLVLWPQPVNASARIDVNGAALDVKGDLILRDEKTDPALTGALDFGVGNPNVTVAGKLARSENGAAGTPSLRLSLGAGAWTAKGDVDLSMPAGFQSGSSTLDLAAAAPAVQNLNVGTAVLNKARHVGSGTLNLAQGAAPLAAASFSQTAGALNLNGSDLAITGDLSISNGGPGSLLGLGGRTLKAGGNITLNGSSGSQLALNPATAWAADAGGTLTADWADLGKGVATRATGTASPNCNDLGGNSGWTFVLAPPSITRQPASPLEVLSGAATAFTAKASGSAPLAYAWRKRGDTAVLATDTVLAFAHAAPAQNGSKYYCTVSNGAGSVETLDGVLIVDEPPAIDAQPSDSVVVEGQPVSFAVAAHGSAPLRYKWRKTGDTAVADTNAVIAIAKTAAAIDGASWSCTVSNAYGSVVSRAAKLSLRYPPKITRQPSAADVAEGKRVRFTVAASGTAPLSYAWLAIGSPDTLGRDTVLDVDAASADDGRKFYCVARNAYGNASSNAALLTVGQAPVIASQPQDTLILTGALATFKLRATGTRPLGFAWFRAGKPDTVGRDSTLALAPASAADSGARFTCVVSNKYGQATSREAVLGVARPPVIARQPADLIAVAGQKARFSAGVTGSSPLAFAWTRMGDTAVLSRDSALAFDTVSLADSNTFYSCAVSSPYGSAATRAAKLTVVQAATIVREPADVATGPKRGASFTVSAVGAKPMAYAWRRKGDTTVVGRDSTLKLDSVKLNDDGALFYAIVSNPFGADTTREARLAVVSCDSVFKVAPETLTVDEGQPGHVKGTAACASERQWSVADGPAPRILDPEVDSLAFTAPRLAADTSFTLRFIAMYANGPVHKDVLVKVREAIPDPRFSLPPAGRWNGADPYVIRPSLLNAPALEAARYRPALRYQWFLSAALADTAQAGDSLSLSAPSQGGNLDVTLCMDNGGSASCVIHALVIDLAATRLAARAARLGPVVLSGRTLSWNADAAVRVWDFRGRLLWQGRGRAGASQGLPERAARDLFHGRARLEILK